jgi:hypothetical protein
MSTNVLDQAQSGLLAATRWVLVVSWLALVSFGAGMAFSDIPSRRLAGALCLAFAAGIAAITAQFWIKILPAILGLEVINAFIPAWEGHAVTNPAEPIPRTASILILLILAASSVIATTFQSRQLTTVDRILLLLFLLSQALAIAWFPAVLGFVSMFLCLLVAWAIDRKRPASPGVK